MNLSLVDQLKEYAVSIGIDRLGVTSAKASSDYHRYENWVEKGFAGEMSYMVEETRKKKRSDPTLLLPSATSILAISVNYKPKQEGFFSMARYAWGRDYHKVLKGQLKKIVHWLEVHTSQAFESKIYVDTGPLLERSLAQRSGIGWIGKNTCLIDTGIGSYTYLGFILLSLDLPEDQPASAHCGTCTRCLDACPTDAFTGPYQLDATKCISYHTLESKREIPKEIEENLESWVAGCDICQEVCPWNRKSPSLTLEDLSARSHVGLSLDELAQIDEGRFREVFQGTALLRMGFLKMRQNAQSVLRALKKKA